MQQVTIFLALLAVSLAAFHEGVEKNRVGLMQRLGRHRRQVDTAVPAKCNKLQEEAKCASTFAQTYIYAMSVCGA